MSDELPIDGRILRETLSALPEASPLVHHLTNDVTTSETANVTLHWGGLPVMANAPAEAGDMAAGADALVINTGTASVSEIDAMIDAGRRANEADVPVVLDPVGYGATPHRIESVGRLLDAVTFDVIKGNAGEIKGLAGEEAAVRGVESVGEATGVAETAQALVEETDAVVVVSGETDVVADGETAYELDVGHERMGTFVGSGCMLTSTLATVAALTRETNAPVPDTTAAGLVGTIAYGVAGELAAETEPSGPASYRTAFMDAVAAMATDPPSVTVGDRLERR